MIQNFLIASSMMGTVPHFYFYVLYIRYISIKIRLTVKCIGNIDITLKDTVGLIQL